jgi:hypothetical protein
MIMETQTQQAADQSVAEIKTPNGLIKATLIKRGYWAWRTPNGYSGLEDTRDDALRTALRAQGLRPEDYGVAGY